MTKPQISAVIMARDEEVNIADAIASIGFASQIIVADTGSKDRTMEIARQAGAEAHSIEFDGYGAGKNRAIAFAKYDWVFSLDADERVSPELAKSIEDIVCSGSALDGYSVCRLTYFLGKPIRHSGWYPEYVLRLFKNGKGRFNDKLVHESIEVDGNCGRLDGLLLHYSYKDFESYVDKLNVYSSLNARQIHQSGRRCRLWDILCRPPATFMKMYLFKAGFLDGFHGLTLAALSSFHVLIKYIKLHQLDKKGI